jgi:hypothetical protein
MKHFLALFLQISRHFLGVGGSAVEFEGAEDCAQIILLFFHIAYWAMANCQRFPILTYFANLRLLC